LRHPRNNQYLPSAAERAIHRSEAEGNICRRHGHIAFRLEEILLRSKHCGEIRGPLAVLVQRDIESSVCGQGAAAQESDLVPRLQEGGETIVHLLLRRPLRAAGFDLIWFGVVMTIVMEMGLIHPPVGLNIFVIKNIAPDIPLRDVIWGVMPFVILIIFAVVVLCFVPEIATWFSDLVMGPGK
jgi:hypothetical protein